MKRRIPVLLLCLLLAGCGQEDDLLKAAAVPAETALALPETAPAKPVSAPAVVTEGRTPQARYDLPEDLRRLSRWSEQFDRNAGAALLARAGDAALYGIPGQEDRILLRWGEAQAEFDWPYRTPQANNPALWQLDADGDCRQELTAVCQYGSGTGVDICQLHIVEKSPGGALTDHRLPEEILCGTELTAVLGVETVEGRTFVALGRELVEITDLTEDRSPPQGITAGSIVRFEADPEDPGGIPVRFRGSAYLEGEDYPPTVWYAADISAQVRYENGSFTLTGLHLDSLD